MQLKLFVDDDLAGNPTLRIRACLDRKTLDALERWEIPPSALYILYVVVYNTTEGLSNAGCREKRWLVRADELLASMTLDRPGHHTLFAKIVWPEAFDRATESHFVNYLLSESGRGEYANSVLEYYKDSWFDEHPFVDGRASTLRRRLSNGRGVAQYQQSPRLTTKPRGYGEVRHLEQTSSASFERRACA